MWILNKLNFPEICARGNVVPYWVHLVNSDLCEAPVQPGIPGNSVKTQMGC